MSMIPGQLTVPAPPPEPYRYTCAECGGPVVVLEGVGVMPRPCGHAGRVKAACAAVIALPLTASHGG